jgi:hypothetical protein
MGYYFSVECLAGYAMLRGARTPAAIGLGGVYKAMKAA